MARWRWRSSTAWSKERSSSRSKARLTAPLWPKPRTIWPERGSSPLLPYFCAHRRPERNPTPGSPSTAKLVPFFAATDIRGGKWLGQHVQIVPRQSVRLGDVVPISGDEQSLHAGTQRQEPCDQFRPGHAGHQHIGYQNVNGTLVHLGKGFRCLGIARFQQLVAFALQELVHQAADGVFILHQKDGGSRLFAV